MVDLGFDCKIQQTICDPADFWGAIIDSIQLKKVHPLPVCLPSIQPSSEQLLAKLDQPFLAEGLCLLTATE